jgi:hypothetical protein
MGELRFRRPNGTLSPNATDLMVRRGGSNVLTSAVELWVVREGVVDLGQPARYLQRVREWPAVAPITAPAAPTLTTLLNYRIQAQLAAVSSYWTMVGIEPYYGGSPTQSAWVAPGTTVAEFTFDPADDGTIMHAAARYYNAQDSVYPGPWSAFSNTATISGGL